MTTSFFRTMPNDMAEKNNIDKDYKMHLTPEMMKMFDDQIQTINPFDQDQKRQCSYHEVKVNEIQTQKITREQFEQLSPTQTSFLRRFPYFMTAIFGMFIVIIFISLLLNIGRFSTAETIFMIITMIGFALVIFFSIKSVADTTVNRNSKIAIGTVIFFKKEYIHMNNKTNAKYYVSVALHDQRAYVKGILCNVKDYWKLELDSTVYLVVKGRKAFAVAADSL